MFDALDVVDVLNVVDPIMLNSSILFDNFQLDSLLTSSDENIFSLESN